jgi:hypothetical protein
VLTYILIGSAVLLAAVFARSSVGKLRPEAFTAFAGSVQQLGLVPRRLVRPAAAALVAAEAAAAVLLLVVPVVGFVLATGLLAVFCVVIGTAMHRRMAVACRCFGSGDAPLGRWHLARNGVLVAVAVSGLVATAGQTAPAVWGSLPLVAARPAGAAITVAGALIAALMIMHVDELAELFSAPARR